jgi:hypothetical protein
LDILGLELVRTQGDVEIIGSYRWRREVGTASNEVKGAGAYFESFREKWTEGKVYFILPLRVRAA